MATKPKIGQIQQTRPRFEDVEVDPSQLRSVDFFDAQRDASSDPLVLPERSTLRAVGDLGLAVGQGAAGAFKSLSDLAGAKNNVSNTFESMSNYLGDQKSEQTKALSQAGEKRIKEAEATGDTWEEAKAYMQSLWDQPGDLIAQGIGSFATLGIGKAVSALKLASAARSAGVAKEVFFASAAGKKAIEEASKAGFKANIGVGAGMGVGSVKGSQYDQTLANAKEQGMSTEDAQALADNAQRYGGPGTMQQLLGGGLGILASATGPIERLALGRGSANAESGLMARIGKGFATEGTTEGAQGAQERYSGNLAAIDSGVLAPENSMRGVVGQALRDGTVGGILGGAAGPFEGGGHQEQADTIRSTESVPDSGPLGRAVNAGVEARAQNVEAGGSDVAPQNADQATDQMPADDPVRDRIRAMPDGDRQDALRAYAVVGRADVSKGVQQYNRKLLDRLLAKNEGAPSDAQADTPVTQNQTAASDQLTAQQRQEYERAYRRPIDNPLGDLQGQVRDGTDYTSADDVQQKYTQLENAWLALNADQQTQPDTSQTEGPSSTSPVENNESTSFVDYQVRGGRIRQGLQNALDGGPSNTVQIINGLNQSLNTIGEGPLNETEQQSVVRVADAHFGFLGAREAANLPVAPTQAQDPLADNASMEALIPERKTQSPQTTVKPTPKEESKTALADMSVNDLRTYQQNAQVPAIRQAVSAELKRRRDAAPKADAVAIQSAQEGDVLNPAGKPFKSKMAANLATKKRPGEVVPVAGGFVIRPIQESPLAQDQVSNEAPTVPAVPDTGRGGDAQADGVTPTPQDTRTPGPVSTPAQPQGTTSENTNEVPNANEVTQQEARAQKESVLIEEKAAAPIAQPAQPGTPGEGAGASPPTQVAAVAEQSSVVAADKPATASQPAVTPRKESASTKATNAIAEQVFTDSDDLSQKTPDEFLRAISHDTEQEGDVMLGTGQFVTLEYAKSAAAKHMTSEQLKMPFQYDRVLGIAARGWDRMVAAMAEKPAADTRTATEVEGLRVYPLTVKGEQKWASQNPDNAGTNKVLGDTIHATQEDAEQEAKSSMAMALSYRKRMAEREARETSEREAAAAKKEANKGMTLADHRIKATLDKPTKLHPNAGLGTGTAREAMQKALEQGRLVTTVMEYDPAGKKRDQELLERDRNLPTGNDNYPGVKEYKEAAARVKADKYEKPSYRVYDGKDDSGSSREISKTEHDYAQSLKAKEAVVPVERAQAAIESVANSTDVQQTMKDAVSADKLTNEQVDQVAAMFDKPTPAKADLLDEKEKAAKAKMFNALGKLAALASKNTRMNWTQEEEQQLLPIVIELFDGAMDLGAVTFQKAVAYVRDFIAQGIDQETADAIPFDTLQGAYIAVAGRHKDKNPTPKKEVASYESLSELENTAEIADTATKDAPNDQGSIDDKGSKALDEVATPKDAGVEGERGLAGGDAGGGTSSKPDDSGLTEPGVSGTRSGGSGSTSVRAPKARGKSKNKQSATSGTGPDGAPVPAGSEGLDLFSKPETEAVSATNIQATNFRITESLRLGVGGEAEKFRDNIAAIQSLKAIEGENRRATSAEQAILARYVGWGGLANAFPAPESKQFKPEWDARGKQLPELLTKKEYDLAMRSTLDSHYTSETIVKGMWAAAQQLGFKGGMVAETSMGIGNFIGLVPSDLDARFVGVEYDSLTARMAHALYPQETILNSGIQSVPLPDGAFDLNIGNPPFGSQSLRFQYKPEFNGVSIHNQFFLAGVDALKPGGLQINVVSRYLLDSMDKTARTMLAKRAKLLGAIRLPDTAFKESARTSVVTDIVFLQRLTVEEEADMQKIFNAANSKPDKNAELERYRQNLAARVPTWVTQSSMKDPLGGDPMKVSSYFVANPNMILGTLERSGKMQFKNDITVRPSERDLGELLREAIARLPKDVMVQEPSAIERTLERFKTLSDSLRIALAGQEAGSIVIDRDGIMQQVYERETPEGGYELAKRPLTEKSVWSDSLLQDDAGKWYALEVAMKPDGTPQKVMKGGKETKLNIYTRKTYTSEADIPGNMLLGKESYDKLRQLVGLRNLMVAQINLETEDAPTAEMEGNRAELAKAYAAFVAANGFISKAKNSALVGNMPDGALVQALELGYRSEITAEKAKKTGEKVRAESADPAPILTERVIPKYEPPTNAASPADALSINLSESGRVDLPRIASLLGKAEEEVIAEMYEQADKPLIFKDPEQDAWVTRNEYLTGQVKKKLHAAQAARLSKNVTALEAVQPEPVGAENINPILGSTWVPPKVYADFVRHVTGMGANVTFSKLTNKFSVDYSGATAEMVDQWGADGVSIGSMVSDMLNSKSIKVTTKDSDGNTVVDHGLTALANMKAKAIATEFTDWVYTDATRRKELVDIFNEQFNTRVDRQHDGSHLVLPGKVPDALIAMRRHQKNAIWRGISERFMLLDHVVGAGKTFTAIARAMERRRMGLSKKPAIIVPNHMVEQFTSDVYRLYPGAKVLAAGQKDFEKVRRRQLFAKIASGDWDIVIIPHSSFGFIGIAPETEERYLEQELRAAEAAVKEAWDAAEQSDTGDKKQRKPFGVKEAQRLVDKITARMDKIRGRGRKDKLLTFEQMGIDDMTVDEAHEFKNLFYSSSLENVKGMGNKSGSQKAFDLYNKVRVLRESPSGTVTFMTGTPISNSAVEMFTMMRYLAADDLKELGLEHFDAWRAQYVSHDAGWEPTETGRLKEVNRLGRSWSNMRSLMDLYYSFTDSVGNDQIKAAYAEDHPGKEFPIPKVKGGDRRSVVVQPTPEQIEVLKDTMAGFDSLPDIKDPYERNIERLKLMDRARKVSLDVRAAVRGHDSKEKGGKLERIASEVARIYKQWNADKGTQLIFLDRSVPKAKGDDSVIKAYDALVAERDAAIEANDAEALGLVLDKLEKYDQNELAELKAAQAGGWNAYQQIKNNLIAQGVPANEIRFVQEATNDAQKQAMFDAVNAGAVRVLIGSTPRMGAGTNVQKRLVGLHHADVTWKPSDIEQREGRIIRQGNLFATPPEADKPNPLYRADFEAEILAYAVERTIDAKMWSLNSAKLKTINGIRNYDGSFTMDFEDADSVGMAEIAALASGDPLLLERVKLTSAIDMLELQARQYKRKMFGLDSRIEDGENAIKEAPKKAPIYKEMSDKIRAGHKALGEHERSRSVTVNDVDHKTADDALKAALVSMKEQQGGVNTNDFVINVGKRRLTSEGGFTDAIYDVLGDRTAFLMKVDGKEVVRRADVARDLRKKLEARKDEAEDSDVAIDLGDLLGFPVKATLTKNNSGRFAIALDLKGVGSIVMSESTDQREGEIPATSAISNALSRLQDRLDGATFHNAAIELKQRAEQAEKDLPKLREAVKKPFDKATELNEKRKRLEEIIGLLSGNAPTPQAKPAPDASTNLKQTGAPEANDTDVVFSRRVTSGVDGGLTKTQVDRAFAALLAKWENAPDVVVLESMDDAPKAVRDHNRSQKSLGATGEPEGFFYGGKVYVVADQVTSPAEALRVLFHETLGHFGLRGVFGDKLNSILKQVAALRPKEMQAKAKKYGLDLTKEADRLTAAEEVLAEMAQANPQLGFVKRAVAMIRQALRGMGLNLALSDADIVANYLIPARNFVKYGAGKAGGVVALSRGTSDAVTQSNDVVGNQGGRSADDISPSAQQIEPDDFVERIEPPHRVKDKSKFSSLAESMEDTGWTGRPILAYEDESGGVFALTGSHRIAAAKSLKLEIPIVLVDEGVTEFEDSNGNFLADVATTGDDRVAEFLREAGDYRAAALMDQEIQPNKSTAPDSDGAAFSRTSPSSIRNALINAVPEAAINRLEDMTTSQRGFNRWWHTTVGTQLHKAKVNKEFGRVFYAVQDFMKDTSRMATLAADLAPDLLPRVETIADVRAAIPQMISPATRKKQIKAVSDALFDGTLRFTRDSNGQAVPATGDDPGGLVWTEAELRERGMDDKEVELYRQSRAAIEQSLDNLLAAEVYRTATFLKPEVLSTDPSTRDKLLNNMRSAAASESPFKSVDMALKAIDKQIAMATAQTKRLQTMADDGDVYAMTAVKAAQSLLDQGNQARKSIEAKRERVQELKDAGYAPLMRFGEYTVDVTDTQGDRVFFGMYETQRESNMAARGFREQGLTVSQGLKSKKDFEQFNGVSPETAMLFADMLGVDQNEAMQKWMQNALAEQSALKRHIRRKGIAGFDNDASRVVAAFITSNSRAGSRALHGMRIQENVESVQAGDVKDEALKLAEYVSKPKEEAQAIRSLLFFNYIGGSISSALVNLTQTLIQTFPYLAQHGGAVASAKRIGLAMKLAVGEIRDPELARVVMRAEQDGVIKPQEVYQLQAEASRSLGSDIRLRSFLALWGSFFQAAETFNRRVAFIAAYNTAQEENISNPLSFAEDAVNETQGMYNKGSRPNWGRGAVGATLFTFKNFSIQYVEFLKRLPPKEKALALAVLVLLSGMRGIPFAEDAEDVIDTIAQSMGYSFTSQDAMNQFAVNTIGKPMADFLLQGASGTGILPFDVSQRLGQSDLLPATGLFKPSETKKDDQVLEVFGVAGSFVRDLTKAVPKLFDGQFSEAVRAAGPIAIRNAAKGWDMYNSGIYTDTRGRKVMDASPTDAVLKSIGLQPAGVATESRAVRSQYDTRVLFTKTKSSISEQMALGLFEKNKGKVDSAQERLTDWNTKNPEQKINIDSKNIRRRVVEMQKDRKDRFIKSAPRELRGRTSEAMGF